MIRTKIKKKTRTTSRRLFRYDWPNGDVSFVLAKSVSDAIRELDEVDSADEHMLTEVDAFQVHFALAGRKRGFKLEGFGERTLEYMDVDAALERRERAKRDDQADVHVRLDVGGERKDQKVGAPDLNKPLVLMSEIERRNAWDDMERGPNSLLGGMLDEARTSSSCESVRTAIVVLVLPSGEECFIYGSSEYGDDEGRGSAASCWRFCSRLNALTDGERFERLLLETRLADLHTTRTPELVADDEGHDWVDMDKEQQAKGEHEQIESSNAPWVARIAEARYKRNNVFVSIGMLSMPNGARRPFCENVELGDNEARKSVADNIRTVRRVGLLREGEMLERCMLETELQPLRSMLKPDPLRRVGSS